MVGALRPEPPGQAKGRARVSTQVSGFPPPTLSEKVGMLDQANVVPVAASLATIWMGSLGPMVSPAASVKVSVPAIWLTPVAVRLGAEPATMVPEPVPS